MDDQQIVGLQAAVEESLRSAGSRVDSLNPGDFRAVLETYLRHAKAASEPYLLQFLTVHFLAAEAAGETRNVGSPPADWRIHSREVLAQFRKHQAVALAVLGLDEPTPLDSVEPRLSGLWGGQSTVGDVLDLPLPPSKWAEGYSWRLVPVFSGLEVEDSEGLSSLPVQPLYRLAQLSRRIAHRTGITQQEAVAFLVADEDVTLPWIRATVDERPLAGADGVTLVIGTMEVRPDEVRAAYEQVRADRETAAQGPQGMLIEVPMLFEPAYVRRPIPDKTAALIAFVDKYRADRALQSMSEADWETCNRAFGVEYRGTYKAYGNGQSMRSMYSRAKGYGRGGTP